jgi:hypothetical protein
MRSPLEIGFSDCMLSDEQGGQCTIGSYQLVIRPAVFRK